MSWAESKPDRNFVVYGSFDSMGGDGLHMMMILCEFDDLM